MQRAKSMEEFLDHHPDGEIIRKTDEYMRGLDAAREDGPVGTADHFSCEEQ